MIWNVIKLYLILGILFEIFLLSVHRIAYRVGALRQPEKKAAIYSNIAFIIGIIVWPHQVYAMLKTIYDVKKGKKSTQDIRDKWDELLDEANNESR